jgi:long-chain fatty acid transport protein
MKKAILAATAMSLSIAALAEGYQVNTLSTKQLGMGHTGTALHLGAESMIFNPAGMASMDNTIDVSASISPIFATAYATTGGQEYQTNNNASTPISACMAFSVYDFLKAGVAFYTPYGSSINWSENWPGAMMNQSVKLSSFTLQPTLAWQITPHLSIGAGAMLTWGTVDLNKGLLAPGSLAAVNPLLEGITPASVNLKGMASLTCGYNVGVMYDINDQWSVGVNYRSEMGLRVKSGTATVSYCTDAVRQLAESSVGLIDAANFTSKMPAVSILNFGVAYKPNEKWTFAADGQLSFWSQYKELNIEFDLPEVLQQRFNQQITKNYSNSWTIHLGAEWHTTSRLDLRAGMMIDTTPVNSEYYNPETPGMTKLEPGVGLSFRPIKNLSINAAFMYVAGLGKDGASCSYTAVNPLTGTAEQKTFTADYRVHALIPSIGLTFTL